MNGWRWRTGWCLVGALALACGGGEERAGEAAAGEAASAEEETPPGVEKLGPWDGRDLPPTDIDRVAVGTTAPDFSLRTLSGDTLSLSDFRGEKNVILVFYRGHW
jgi:hypothetical protein